MHGNEAPEPLPKPESQPPEALHLRENCNLPNHRLPGASSTWTYHDGQVEPIARADYSTLSSASQVGATRCLPPKKRQKKICGIKRSTFILSLVLGFIVVGAAVGGAVSGSLAARQAFAACSPTASPPTSSYFSIPTAGVAVEVDLDCNKYPGYKPYPVDAGTATATFTPSCGTDWPDPAQDILALTSYTEVDCMKACAAYNHARGATECIAAVFIAGGGQGPRRDKGG
ncbi:hypothetical protein PG985_001570 [Apiospora marii]|uniref:uncharacterized protein n=1 Tax=Apiospora marii TaxID=335849 RepID=UPI00312DE247